MLTVFPWQVVLFGFYFILVLGFQLCNLSFTCHDPVWTKVCVYIKIPQAVNLHKEKVVLTQSFWGFRLWSLGPADLGAVGKDDIDGNEHTLKQSCTSHNGQETKEKTRQRHKVPLLFSRAYHSDWKVPRMSNLFRFLPPFYSTKLSINKPAMWAFVRFLRSTKLWDISFRELKLSHSPITHHLWASFQVTYTWG